MIISYGSFTARLYRWFYDTNVMPSNLCPYFWKCVLMYVLFIPYSVLSLPVIVLDFISIKSGEGNLDIDSKGKPIVGLFIYLILFILFSVGFTLITIWTATKEQFNVYSLFYVFGIISISGLIVGGIVIGIQGINNTIKYRKLEKGTYTLPKSSMVKEYIKAKYKKYCPVIEWKK